MAYKIGSSPRGITWSSHRRKREKKLFPSVKNVIKKGTTERGEGIWFIKLRLKTKQK